MKNVVVYEVQTFDPKSLGLKTDLLVDVGMILYYKERNTYGDIYYIGDGIITITEIPACCENVRYFVIRNGGRNFLIESLDTPVIIAEKEFLDYLKNLTEKVVIWTAYGLWYSARFIFTDPNERKAFEKFMTKKPYDRHYIWYYYSGYIDKDVFLELVDKVKGMTNCE